MARPAQPDDAWFLNLGTDAVQECTGYRLEKRAEKWVTVSDSGVVRTASGRMIFVVAGDGTIFTSSRTLTGTDQVVSHADLAGGRPVLYAGEMQFSGRTNRGRLHWWDNRSGHYQPGSEFAHQAGLPMDLFEAFLP
jgi:hypothetical protein